MSTPRRKLARHPFGITRRCPSPSNPGECAMMRERAVAGGSAPIPDCPKHGPWTENVWSLACVRWAAVRVYRATPAGREYLDLSTLSDTAAGLCTTSPLTRGFVVQPSILPKKSGRSQARTSRE